MEENMPKETPVIQNVYDTSYPVRDKYHLKYLQNLYGENITTSEMIDALRSKNREAIESVVKTSSNRMKSSILLIGVACVIIDRENLYSEAGHKSYLTYALSLADLAGMPPQTISDAKIIGEVFVDYFNELQKVNFNPEGNAHKLRYIRAALENHPGQEAEVFKRAASDPIRKFKEWAYEEAPKQLPAPEPEPKISIRVSGQSIYVDDKPILNFPDDLPQEEKKNLTKYLGALYRIRAVGNEPFIVSTYDEREQRAIMNFLKKYRLKK
jgi:hypothetical protein